MPLIVKMGVSSDGLLTAPENPFLDAVLLGNLPLKIVFSRAVTVGKPSLKIYFEGRFKYMNRH
jgi:hypothetical protein